MSLKQSPRKYSLEFKRYAVARFHAEGRPTALARELGIRTKFLYQWRDQLSLGVPPDRAGRLPRPPKKSAEPKPEAPPPLSSDAQRIAELERLVARQSLELDFFRGALQHNSAKQKNLTAGETACTPTSGPACGRKAD